MRAAAAAAVAAFVLLVSASPASAHGGEEPRPTNYRSRITGIDGALAGVAVRVVENGDRIEVHNHSGRVLVVAGYEGEPYLRVGPDGAWENTRSPAVFLNTTRSGTASVPKSADATAPPRWRRVSGDDTVRWHDHRTHWMGSRRPPIVDADPSSPHVVIPAWTLELRQAGRTMTVTGQLSWLPPPPPLPWFAIVATGAAALALLLRSRVWLPVLVAATAIVVGFDAAHVTGKILLSRDSLANRLFLGFFPFVGWAVAVSLVAVAVRERRFSSGRGVIVAMIFFILTTLGDLSVLWHARPAAEVAPVVARVAVVACEAFALAIAYQSWQVERRYEPGDGTGWAATEGE
jgi:hypothetical protein